MTEPKTSTGDKRSKRIWAIFFALYAASLTFLPAICQTNYRIDVLHQLGIGREFVFGTYYFPAFSTWLVEIVSRATFRAPFAPFLTATLLIAATLYIVWRFALLFLPREKAFFAVAPITAYWYFNMGSAMYNNNGSLTLFWVAALYFFYRALTENKARLWVATGAALGLSLISKHTAAILAASILAYTLVNRDARRRWRTPGPYLAAAVAILVCLPNILFSLEHREAIVAYVASKKPDGTFGAFVGEFFVGWATQLLLAAPILLTLLPILGGVPRLRRRGEVEENAPTIPNEHKNYPATALLLPILTQMIFQAASGVAFAQDSYGFQLWPLTGVAILYFFRGETTERAKSLAFILIASISLGEILSLPISTTTARLYKAKRNAKFFPGKALANEVDAVWSERFPDAALPTVAGDNNLQWNAGVYSRFEPTIVAPDVGAWASDATTNERGGVVLWRLDEEERGAVPERIRERFPEAVWAKEVELRYRMRNPAVEPERVGIGIVEGERALTSETNEN